MSKRHLTVAPNQDYDNEESTEINIRDGIGGADFVWRCSGH